MKKYIISVLGKDRPGIIASVARLLYREDFNIEDVSQTILQAEFSGSFIVSGPDKSNAKDLREALRKETDDDSLFFHVRQLDLQVQPWSTNACESFVITTSGPDRKGLVAHIAEVLAACNVNVTQLQAVFRGGDDPNRNIMIYEVDIPCETDLQALRKALGEKARALHLDVSIQHKNIFEAINRI